MCEVEFSSSMRSRSCEVGVSAAQAGPRPGPGGKNPFTTLTVFLFSCIRALREVLWAQIAQCGAHAAIPGRKCTYSVCLVVTDGGHFAQLCRCRRTAALVASARPR